MTQQLPTIHETTFGGFVEATYGYATRQAINPQDSSVLEMVRWTMDDSAGPRIGWGERIHYWLNTDECEQIWRHRPAAGDLDQFQELRDEAVALRGR